MSSDPFKTRDHVDDFDAISRRYDQESEATRARHRYIADIAYGDSPEERLDLVLPDAARPGAPIHMFVHGGYWRAGSRKSYSYIAEPVVAAGGVAVVVDYSLMPGTRMAAIVGQVRRAALWVAGNARQYGGDPTRFTASGHSAGAHLAYYLAARAQHETNLPDFMPRALLLLSGIYDLSPIPGSFLQPEIHLTGEEVRSWSPVGASPSPDVDRVLAVGDKETAPFHDQQAAVAQGLDLARTTTAIFAGHDHMSVVLAFGQASSPEGRLLHDTVLNS